MARTLGQAAAQFLEEVEAREGGEARRGAAEVLGHLLGGVSHAPGAAPTRARPRFPRKGAAGSPLSEIWVYELQADDLEPWQGLEEADGEGWPPRFLSWLWDQGYLGGELYEGLREALSLAPDPGVRARQLEARLMQRVLEQAQPLAEHLMNPALYLGLPQLEPTREPPRAEWEGWFTVSEVGASILSGQAEPALAGAPGLVSLEVGPEVAALARPGDRLWLGLGRVQGGWRILAVGPRW